MTQKDAPRLAEVGYDVFLDDAEVIEVGRLRLHAIHNPGHTPGSISFKVEGTAAVHRRHPLPRRPGQHLVRGRRFPDDHPLDRHQAVPVPEDTVILPGHGDDSSIGVERPTSRVDRPGLVRRYGG
ncbi:MAG: MBL fold metallo-hydrolase [Ilumatobacteraceae bacterium]